MMLSLGMFQFELGTLPFQQRSRASAWRHGRSPRFGARDASQYLGPGEDKVTLSGALIPGLAGSFGSLDTLRDMADAADAYPLVEGSGVVRGYFVIDNVKEDQSIFTDDGRARKGGFTIELTRIADDAVGSVSGSAVGLISLVSGAPSPTLATLTAQFADVPPGADLVHSIAGTLQGTLSMARQLTDTFPLPASLTELAERLGVDVTSSGLARQLDQLVGAGVVEPVEGGFRLVRELML